MALAQMFSIGALWIGVHCVGMCGTLLGALDLGNTALGVRPFHAAGRVLLYQAGRSVVYALFGALAGAFGALFSRAFSHAGAVLSVALGLLFLSRALAWPRASLRPTAAAGSAMKNATKTDDLVALRARPQPWRRIIDDVRGALSVLALDRRPSRAFYLGAVLAGMPCMITLWALGLAASVASPLRGAVVMLTLVLLTTPVLLLSTLLARAVHALLRGAGRHAPRALLAVSSVWLVLVGLAGGGVIPHAHVGATAFGRHWLVMFF
jgi:sulfite exporter TauE/SafE